MCEGVLEAVERRAAGRRVARVGVRVGALLRVVPEAFQQSFEMVAAGGVAEGATTVLTVVPAEVTCTSCGHTFTTQDPLAICPSCASLAGDHRGGDDLVLEWVEYAGEVS